MNFPQPSITVNVDVTNPGQFFACCGLLELADRLWPGAEGWFDDERQRFNVACKGDIEQLLDRLSKCQLNSSLGDDGLKRLGTLLSLSKNLLSEQDKADKHRLSGMWKVERVCLSEPFDLWLDWWWDDHSGVKLLKTWAAKQFVLEIARPMLKAVASMEWGGVGPDCLTRATRLTGLPFYFDAENNTQNTARDFGFATFTLKMPSAEIDRPLIELLTFIGLQRFRPERPDTTRDIIYTAWSVPLTTEIAAAVTSQCAQLPNCRSFRFRMLYRTQYMKAFQPAIPVYGA